MSEASFELRAVGQVQSVLTDLADAPKQGDEGAPEAWIAFDPSVTHAMSDIEPGAELIVLTWLHQAERATLRVHPRGNPDNAEEGVFTTRSPDRPNPIGLHRVRVAAVKGLRIRVENLEAIDGTPVIDVKPVLGRIDDR